jgi:Zn-dependent protease
MLRGGRRSNAYVALAGPASNLVMAIFAAIVIRLLIGLHVGASEAAFLGLQVVGTFLVINVALFVFNLIPAPPLDGAAVLVNLLPPRWAWRVAPFLNQWGTWILVALIGLAILPGMFPQASALPNPIGDLVYGIVNLLVGA